MTREEGEKILVNHGEIVIEIIQIRGKLVRLAFKASREISIQRYEAVPQNESEESKK